MAAVEHWTFEQTTEQSHTGDTNWTTKATVSSATFTAGATYLILYSGQLGCTDSTAQNVGVRLAYGATPTEITETRAELEPSASSATAKLNWAGHTVWTAGSGEDLVVQIHIDLGARTVVLDSIYLVGIRLDAGGLVYEDDADATQATHTTTFASRAAVTVSAAGTENWLVLASYRVRCESITVQMQARINRDSGTEVEPAVSYELEDATVDEFTVQLLPRVYTLSAGSHTFALETRDASSAANVYESSRVTAIKLTDQFPDHGFFWNASSMSLNTTGFVNEAGNVDITPSTAQDMVLLAFATYDLNSGGSTVFSRIQVGGTTHPTGSDTNTANLSNDIVNDTDIPLVRMTVENLAASLQDIDFDLSPGAVSGFTARYRALVAWGLEFVPSSTDVDGTAAVTVPPVTVAASGAETFTGTAAAALSAVTVAATGAALEPVTGTSAIVLSAPTVASTGAVTDVTGASAVVLGAAAVASVGAVTISGSAAVTLPSVTVATSGVETISGSSAVVLNPVTTAASGGVAPSVIGTSALVLSALTTAASGVETITGSSTVVLSAALTSGAGSSINGTSAVMLNAPVAAATGSVANPVTGASVVGMQSVVVAAVGEAEIIEQVLYSPELVPGFAVAAGRPPPGVVEQVLYSPELVTGFSVAARRPPPGAVMQWD